MLQSEQLRTESLQAQCIVLAGGKGSRLGPLVDQNSRSKPSLQLGDSNLMIDPALLATGKIASEVIVASRGNRRIKSHLENNFSSGLYTEGMETEQRESGYVVFDNREKLYNNSSNILIVTPGDHLHDFNLSAALENHLTSGADVTVLGMNVAADEAVLHDALNVREDGEVIGFKSKKNKLEDGRDTLISIGTYIFQKESLLKFFGSLKRMYPVDCDIGYDLLPRCFNDYNVGSFAISGYWKDLGTIDRYFAGNMFLLANPEASVVHQLGVHRVSKDGIEDSLIAPTSIISDGAKIKHSIVGEGAVIETDTFLDGAIVMPKSVITAGTNLRCAITNEGAVVHPSYSMVTRTNHGVGVIS